MTRNKDGKVNEQSDSWQVQFFTADLPSDTIWTPANDDNSFSFAK